MIELTQQQILALGNPNGTPPHVVNPQTQETFVLEPLAEYGRLVEEAHDDSPWTDEERNALLSEACDMLDSFGRTP